MRALTWRTFLVISLATVAGYQFLPSSPLVRMVAYDGLAAASVVCVVIGARRQSPGKRAAWYWLAGGLFTFLLGDLVYTGWEPLAHAEPPFPNVGDFFYLACYPLLVAGLGTLIRARTPGRDRASLIDATIIATAAGVMAWMFLMEPYASDTSLPVVFRALLTAYPAMDVLLLAATVRLAVGRGARPPAFYFLAGAATILLITDALYGLSVLAGTFEIGGPLDIGWMLFYALPGVAALHPSAGRLYERAAIGEQRLSRSRLALLGTVTLLVPVADGLSGRDAGNFVTAVASAALFLLVLARMSGLLRALEASIAKVAELQRRRGERRFQALVQNAADMLLVVDSRQIVTFASPSAKSTLGLDPTGWNAARLLEFLGPDDARSLLSSATAVSSSPGARTRPLATRIVQPDGETRHLEVIVTNLLSDPDVEGIVLNARDVTEQAELEQQLRHLAFHDPLTGLANRALFGDRVEQALRRVSRTQGKIAVLFCDIDNFKTVNDSLGHAAGDQMLTTVAERLAACIRPGDTVARVGGDEFGVLLEDLTEADQVTHAATRLLAELRLPWSIDGNEVMMSASIGIALGSSDHGVGDLLRQADTAMYEAKSQGKSSWRLYEPDMHAAALDRLKLTSDLRRGLERNEFYLDYQPIVELATGKIKAVEALVRWQHPERGLVPPGDFIETAEASESIAALGSWVLNEACRQGRRWQDTSPDDGMRVSVNVSARQIQDPGFIRTVIEALEASGLNPSRLVLELTESVLLDEPDQAMATFTELKELGVRLAIDDFGTGYSSLSYLQRMPVDIIKIDKSFVDNLDAGVTDSSLAGGIIELTKTLGVVAVAEGIETTTQVAALRDLACEFGQGFYFARPMPADAIIEPPGEQSFLGLSTAGAQSQVVPAGCNA